MIALSFKPETPWCVYAHRLAGGVWLYIGSGDSGRPFDQNRSELWRERIAAAGKYQVEILEWHSTQKEARRRERQLIAQHQPELNQLHTAKVGRDSYNCDGLHFDGTPFRTERLRRGWTLREAAKKAHISNAYWSQVENSQHRPNILVLYQMARACGFQEVVTALKPFIKREEHTNGK